jgi:tetratricopeptide (TPR) repeat protein
MMLRVCVAMTVISGLHPAGAQTDAAEQTLKQAIALHQAGDINGAIDAYRKYLRARPESPMALSNLGAAYARVGRYEDAVAQYQQALKIQPNNAPVELNLALAWYKTGETEKAAPVFEKVHKAAPGQLQPALLLADCWLAMGKHKEAIELLTPFSGGKPENPAVQYALGTIRCREDRC